ncbi:metallophosphoesterase [Thermanaerovibrio acidaminovorans DSM 6589]|uniref:Metallophosphoesterase n=1 Tax=Thermanaerovibrio acidaminovorans (strain ATCC 49978 / DSM 6589 / Su883) TaxID=525903 RepID=D1B7Z2_THEAS|nr:metallophosphoesterase [Thermanaerovibrio acidaminovorans]ACZ18395.1 metallophosphoesterase [Thermanaerovibrio acidaminovorans DSM 6589]
MTPLSRPFRGLAWFPLLLLLLLLIPQGANGAVRGLNHINLDSILSTPVEGELRFLVVGDTRGPGSRFRFLVPQMREDQGLFVIHLGDLTNRGTQGEYREALELLRSIRKPFLVVIGNHELVDRGRGRFEDIFGSWRDRAFVLGGALLVLLDNADGRPLSEERLRWLDRELASHPGPKMVFMHQPLFDPRPGKSHAMDERGAREMLEVLKRHRVDRVFASHVHAFFQGDWDGVPYTISGGGGASLYSRDPESGFHHYHRVTVGPGGVRVETVPLGGYVR